MQTNKFRLENDKLKKTVDKVTQRLMLLEKNEAKQKQYAEIRK